MTNTTEKWQKKGREVGTVCAGNKGLHGLVYLGVNKVSSQRIGDGCGVRLLFTGVLISCLTVGGVA